jgi:dephospho-CoA kinase
MIVGLTGTFAAGKGTVAAMLGARGFCYHSLSDILREELVIRGVPEGREALMHLGNELREAGGPGVLAERLLDRLQDQGDHIVDSIRNPEEVRRLRTLDDFTLVGVDADQRVRFERLRNRARQGDPETWEAFQALEAAETVSDDPTKQQLARTWTMRDATLINDGSEEELRAGLETLLGGLSGGSA